MAAEGMVEDSKPRGETITDDSKSSTQTTIFVGNLPFDTRDDDLEKEFSDFGPIKRAFIVKDKDKNSKSRGCGYVQFVLQEDADKCAKASKSIGARKLRLSYANKKPKHLKRKAAKEAEEAKQNGDDIESTDNKLESKETEKKDEKADAPPPPKAKKPNPKPNPKPATENNGDTKITEEPKSDGKTDIQKTIVLTGLTAKVKRKAFRILCEGFGEIENIVYPVPERDEVTAFVRFKEYKSAIRATQKIPGKKVKKSGVLSACLLIKENKHPTKKQMQKSRLIIRNLSFKCEEEYLTEVLSKFGKILNISIPTKKVNGKDVKIGCAFVQFAHAENAKAALEGMNLKEIKDRQVVVDWAVAKDVYKEKVNEENKKEEKAKEEGKPKKDKKKKKENKDDVDVEKVSEEGKEETKKKKKKEKKKKDSQQEEEEEDKLEEETLIDGESEDEDEMNETGAGEDDEEDEENEDEDEDEDEDEEEGEDIEDDMDDDDMEDEEKEIEAKPKREMKDAKEGKTIFIRNLSYDIDQDMLAEEFESFGEIDYCKVVQDYETGRSKGTAFLKFKTKESADKCLGEFDTKEKSGVNTLIDGRAITVSLAVTKGKLGEMQRVESDERKKTDKRNLYLAAEGIITRNSPAAEGLTDLDFKKREKSLAEKKAKLKNPNYFVSRTRLCLKNLPVSADADALRVSLLKYTPRHMNITEVKIMRSKDRRDAAGLQRSLGFGFIDLETHEDALALLRATNNNPEIFGPKRRPIVEFSVENSKALKMLEMKKKRTDVKTARNEQNAGSGDDEEKPEVDKKALMEKIHQKRVKRIARYKKKREQKKLDRANQNGDDAAAPTVTTTTTDAADKENNETASAKVKSPRNNNKTKNKDQNKNSKNKTDKNKIENNKVTAAAPDRGFKRKLPVELTTESSVKRPTNRNVGKKKVVNEEEKFNKMVQQYKQKLFGDKKQASGGAKKKEGGDRWFE